MIPRAVNPSLTDEILLRREKEDVFYQKAEKERTKWISIRLLLIRMILP